jgi:death on curing protein
MPEPQWLDGDLVDDLHAQSLRIHGGLPGIRDGNKRLAIISAVAFLGSNGIELDIRPGELVPQTIRAARCKEHEREQEEDAISLWFQLSSRRRATE